MKRILPIVILASIALCGCVSPSRNELKLQSQVATLKEQNADLTLSVSNLQARVDQLYQFAWWAGHRLNSNSAAILEISQAQVHVIADQARMDAGKK